jgi:hypothetical protein
MGDSERLRAMAVGDEWWEASRSNLGAPNSRQTSLFISAKRAGITISVTRWRALNAQSDEVIHLIRVKREA